MSDSCCDAFLARCRGDGVMAEIGTIEQDQFTGLHFLIVRVEPRMAGVTIDYCPWCGSRLRPLN